MKSFCTTRCHLASDTSVAEPGRSNRLQPETAAELAALLPALLDRDFKGEL